MTVTVVNLDIGVVSAQYVVAVAVWMARATSWMEHVSVHMDLMVPAAFDVSTESAALTTAALDV